MPHGKTGTMMKARGFTLIELMITLAIAAILLTIAIPSFTDLIKNNRLVASTNLFVASVNVARSEAVKRRRNAIICTSSDYTNATPSCSGSTDWSNGWIVWVDTNSDGNVAQDEVISVYEALDANVTFTGTISRLTYRPSGLANTLGTMNVCDDRTGETGRTIDISASGRPSISDLNC